MTEFVWVALITAVANVVITILTKLDVARTNRKVDSVHTLVNSQKTLLETQLAEALAEVKALKTAVRMTEDAAQRARAEDVRSGL